MMYTAHELCVLARAYIGATKIAESTLSKKMTRANGSLHGNDKLVSRLFLGRSCLMTHGEMASDWFDDNWPRGTPWPAGVSRYRNGGRHKEAAE